MLQQRLAKPHQLAGVSGARLFARPALAAATKAPRAACQAFLGNNVARSSAIPELRKAASGRTAKLSCSASASGASAAPAAPKPFKW